MQNSKSAYPESFGRGTGLSVLYQDPNYLIDVRNVNSGDWITGYMASALG